MNNHLIACVLVLVGCLAVPLGGQGLSIGDTQYLNETEAPAPDECQIFQSAVLAPAPDVSLSPTRESQRSLKGPQHPRGQ